MGLVGSCNKKFRSDLRGLIGSCNEKFSSDNEGVFFEPGEADSANIPCSCKLAGESPVFCNVEADADFWCTRLLSLAGVLPVEVRGRSTIGLVFVASDLPLFANPAAWILLIIGVPVSKLS